MATNYTENFDLCQWEPTDPVIRTDFNADNAKLEAALTALEEAKTRLDRTAATLAYYTGWLTMTNMADQGRIPPQRAILCQDFSSDIYLTCGGGAVIQNNTLFLNGAGQTGTMTEDTMVVGRTDWTQARMWIHLSGGTVTPSLNGMPMTRVGTQFSNALNGTRCFDQEFVLDAAGTNTAQVSLALSTGTASSMTVFDYFIMFF